MGFLDLVVRRRVLTTVLVLIVVILGGLAYASLGLRRFPQFEFPMATIMTVYPGGSPEEVETEISKRIEDAISSIAGIDEIRSYSQQGVSLVMVQFNLEEDINIKAMDIRDKVDQVRRDLPGDAEAPVVSKFNFASFPVMTLALVGPQDVNELYRIADEQLKDRLSQVPGVGEVQLTGGQRREIHILLDPVKLREHNISVDEVTAALQSTNLEIPGGFITEPTIEYTIRTTGRFRSPEEILRVPVRNTGDGVLEIRHLGEVKDTFEEARSASRADGKHSIVMSVLTQSDANEVAVVDAVKAKLNDEELKALIPAGAELFVAEDTSDFIRGALDNLRGNIILGTLLTALSLYLFLGSWRGTIIVAVVIPTSVIATFMFLLFSGFTINILTLTGLALAVGIVVNNSILILENTQRFVDAGMPPVEAAIKGTQDIGLAILSTTATNLVVFLPIAFMGEIIGRLFKEFGLTIVYVTVVSLGMAFTLTPMMCGAMLRETAYRQPHASWFVRAFRAVFGFLPWVFGIAFEWVHHRYLNVLDWCLKWWPVVAALAVVSLGWALFAIAKVAGTEFFPPSDEGRLRIVVETPVGSSLEFTSERVAQVERIVQEHTPTLQHYYSRIGRVSGFIGSSSSGTNLAELGVVVVDKAQRDITAPEIADMLRPYMAEVDSAKITVSASGHEGGGGSPIQVEISGADMDALRSAAADVKKVLQTVPGASDVNESWRSGQPEIRITPNQGEVGRHRLSVRDLALAVRAYVEGRKVSQFKDRGEDYDIRLRLAERYRKWGEDADAMFVKSPVTGQLVAIGQLADLRYETGPTVITRKDRMRLITVEAQLTGERTLGQVINEARQRIDSEVALPSGVYVTFGGQAEMMQKNFKELFKALGTATGLTFLLLAGIIESFLIATLIMLAIPVSLVGIAVAMLLGGTAMNIFSLMAMIMLVGMVINNAIVILDYATRKEFAHRPPQERVREACALRFRMLMMANLTTMVAMIPLSLGLGFAGEIFQPIAVVEIGGIAAITVLSELAIPPIYVAIETMRQKLRGTSAA